MINGVFVLGSLVHNGKVVTKGNSLKLTSNGGLSKPLPEFSQTKKESK